MAIKDWTEIYNSLAKALFRIYETHGGQAGKRLFTLLDDDLPHKYEATWLDKFRTSEDRSIDPIAFFSSFNDSKHVKQKRLDRILDYYRLLEIEPDFDDIDFIGCPTPVTVRLMSVRSMPNQSVLWTTFRNVMLHGRQAINEDVFEKLAEIYGVGIPSFTIWLFWIRPNDFLPLDRNTVRYLIANNQLSHEPKSFQEYLHALSQSVSFLEISRNAVAYFERAERKRIPSPEQKITMDEDNNNLIEKNVLTPKSDASVQTVENEEEAVPKNFRLIGIKLVADPKGIYKKSLDLHKTYHFYKAFDVVSDSLVVYRPENDLQIYSQTGLSINISAIVGQNGSGKSALTELLYVAMNNLAVAHPQIVTELVQAEGLYMSMYFLSDFLYRMEWREKVVCVYRYTQSGVSFSNEVEIPLAEFNLSQFFFTIGINYSIYGLNSVHLGDWIEKVFKKNDAYQVPVNLNPYRERGNIDINIEEHLVKSRLLSNILQPVLAEEDVSNQLRQLTDSKSASTLHLKINQDKFKQLYVIKSKITSDNKIFKFTDAIPYFFPIIEELCRVFAIDHQLIPDNNLKPKTTVDYAFLYILKKLVAIARTYPNYSTYFDEVNNMFIDQDKYIAELFVDHSHITYKLRQAINFIKFDHIRRHINEKNVAERITLLVEELSNNIEFIKQSVTAKNRQTIYFIPPSFFKTAIIMSDGSSFDHLSSGQKQRIHAVTTLVYHLINVNSVLPAQDMISYPFANIIFDEVELYYHPEMQRNMLSYMLNYIQKLELDQIAGLNFLLITHSPFILSDLPHHNILFMKSEEPEMQTLGANIHDLLAHNFFLDKGFMGERIKVIISELVKYLSPKADERPGGWTPKSAKALIDSIGEPLIRIRLDHMYTERFKEMLNREQRISELKRELSELQSKEHQQ